MKFDVFRGVMHALGHLFGASHDPYAVECAAMDAEMNEFINPYLLHPIQQTNVGVRPNSFRYSACARDAITMFLASNGAHCLKETSPSFCGNGNLLSVICKQLFEPCFMGFRSFDFQAPKC